MTDTEQPDTAPDLRSQAAEARAEVARISERIVAGETDVTAADLIAAEQEADRLQAVVDRQSELEREGNRRRQADDDRAAAESLAKSIADQIRQGGGIAEELSVLQAGVRKALADLIGAVDAHNATVSTMTSRVAVMGRRVNLADFGLIESKINNTTIVGVLGAGHLGPVDTSEAVAQALDQQLPNAPASGLTEQITQYAKSYRHRIGQLVKVASEPQTREQQLTTQERRRVKAKRQQLQQQIEAQLRAIRSGTAAKAAAGHDRSAAAPDAFPTTEEAFRAKYPDFVEGALTYAGPIQ